MNKSKALEPTKELTIVITIITFTSILLLISGCYMTKLGTIKVYNNSEYKMNLLFNDDYLDDSISNATVSSFINPNNMGTLGIVNKDWEEYLNEKEKIIVFFVEWKPDKFYKDGYHGTQKVYGYMFLTKAKLDSLGGVITFPDDVTLTE